MFVSKVILAGTAGTACVVALGLTLSGCDSAESNPTKPAVSAPVGTTDLEGSSDFDRDLISAKQSAASSAERAEAIDAVLSRYGVPHSAARQTAEALPGPVTQAAAAKTASQAAAFAPVVREFQADNGITHTFYKTVNVGANQTLTIAAVASTAGADPFVVALHKEGGNESAYPVQVVAYNDDVSSVNRNSAITWKNTSAFSKKIEIVAYNYLSASGAANISIGVDGVSSYYPSRFLGGAVVYGSNPIPAVPDNCYPSFTRVTEANRYGGGFYAAALVLDAPAKKGGLIWDRPDVASQILDFSPMLNNPYPSFALIFEATDNQTGRFVEEASSYSYKQQDFYSCIR